MSTYRLFQITKKQGGGSFTLGSSDSRGTPTFKANLSLESVIRGL